MSLKHFLTVSLSHLRAGTQICNMKFYAMKFSLLQISTLYIWQLFFAIFRHGGANLDLYVEPSTFSECFFFLII